MPAWPPLTIADVDRRLDACRDALRQARFENDTLTIEAMDDTIDELLDRRLAIPKQRAGS